jgi:capsular exopolysaccharide synthesis family protein
MSIPGQTNETHIYDYLRTLFKWRRVALVCFAIIVGTVAIASFVMTPVYKATTRILIEREAPKVLNMQDLLPIDANSTEFYQTQYKVLQSRSLALRVIQALNLSQNPVFNPQRSQNTSTLDKKAKEAVLVGKFLKRLKIDPIRNSRLVDITYESTDRQLASDIANMVAKGFIEQNIAWTTETSGEAKDFLTKQIEEQKKTLEESEQALQGYKEKYGIVQITPFQGDKEKENIAMQKLGGLTGRLVEEQSRRVEVEARYREVQDLLAKGVPIESMPQVMDNYLIQRLKENEARLVTEMSELSKKYGEKHPKMTQLKSEIEANRQKIRSESQNVLASIKNELAIARAREANARSAVEGQKAETQKLSERSIEFSVLAREADKNRELYENLLKRLKETSVAGELGTTNVRIVDRAEVPIVPARPKPVQYILLSVVVGLFMSCGLAFFFEYLDNTLKTPDDVEKYVETPCLALIPRINFMEEIGQKVSSPEIIVHHKPKSTVAEGFRSLRTSVLFSSPDTPLKTILISSFIPREGKTFITANLALVIAYSGESVLLVDADMRKPQIHKVFGLENRRGLSNVIVGEEPSIHPSVLHEKLDVMTCGPVPPNPAELLGSKKMAEFIDQMKGTYDKIIIDSPPISSVTDAVVLSKLMDCVVFVVHGGATTRETAQHGSRVMRDANAKVIGAVLNNIDIGRESYYYSHYYHYYYHYYDYYGHDGDGRKRRRRHEWDQPKKGFFARKSPSGNKQSTQPDGQA